MGKAAGIVGVVLGTIIMIVGLFLLFVVFASKGGAGRARPLPTT